MCYVSVGVDQVHVVRGHSWRESTTPSLFRDPRVPNGDTFNLFPATSSTTVRGGETCGFYETTTEERPVFSNAHHVRSSRPLNYENSRRELVPTPLPLHHLLMGLKECEPYRPCRESVQDVHRIFRGHYLGVNGIFIGRVIIWYLTDGNEGTE